MNTTKTTVAAEELRGQLGDRVPGAWAIAARSMGMTTEDFDKKVTARLIKANDLVPALAKSMKELAAPGIDAAMNQLGITQNKMANSWKSLASLFFQEGGVKDALTTLYDSLDRLARNPIMSEFLVPLTERLMQLLKLIILTAETVPGLFADIGRSMSRYDGTFEGKLSPEELQKFKKQSWLNRTFDKMAYSNAVKAAEITGKPQKVEVSIGVDGEEFKKVFTVTAQDVTRNSIELWSEGIPK